SEEQSSITKSEDISTVLQNRPLGDSSNHDTYVSSEESEIRGYASSILEFLDILVNYTLEYHFFSNLREKKKKEHESMDEVAFLEYK
ncbi:7255_t:CDS:2, partial [Entrophospora sp. SA101]